MMSSLCSVGQDGHLINAQPLDWHSDSTLTERITENGELKPSMSWLNDVIIEEIYYESDGLSVKGYRASPRIEGSYPCIIYNRGGNKEFGKLNSRKAVFILARLASWGYVVVASQYRGNDGGQGKEEFGGADVNDIMNLIPMLAQMEKADTSRMGIYGWSRGGMMTYLALMRTDQFKGAVVGGGLSDLRMMMSSRGDNFETVYSDNIPGYADHKKEELRLRSAIDRVGEISKNTPILMMHGTSDWRVVPQMALDLSSAFIELQVPHRLVLFEGGDHGLNEFDDEVDQMVRDWFGRYVRDEVAPPILEPHGK